MDRGASRWQRIHKVQLGFGLLMSLLTVDRMCAKYGFEKPNDRRALDLMNTAAKAVVTELPEITIAYGVSDEFRFVRRNLSRLFMTNTSNSFVFHKACTLFDRRARFVYTHSPILCCVQNLRLLSKLVSTVVSTFTANYVYFWSTHFPDSPLSPPLPSFDGRAVCYPSVQNLRDYMSWRQADCRFYSYTNKPD
jgi:tRNA(His) guanylyltransferase